jgi:DNA-directed RNA polymerase specialized sigma subunit
MLLQNYGEMDDKSKIIAKKMYGDRKTIAEMMGTTPGNVSQIIRRPGAKRHKEALDALSKLIAARDKLINQ